MKKVDLIEQYEQVLRECEMAGIAVHDWKHAELYRFVMKVRSDGNKMDYCVARACERYAISEATVWRILRSMEQTVTITI